MSCELPIVLRVAERKDLAYVCHSWLESLVMSTRYMPGVLTYGRWHDLVQDLVYTNRVLLGCFDEDANYIIGWVCIAKDGAVLYAYTRKDKRRMGLVRLLLGALGVTEPVRCAAWSREAEVIAATHRLDYRPFEQIELYEHSYASHKGKHYATEARVSRPRISIAIDSSNPPVPPLLQ